MSKLPSSLSSSGHASAPARAVPTRHSLRNHCLAIGASAVVLVLGFGTLGATTQLSGAVMATGSLVVKSNVKKVSHQTGGLVGVLLIDEGSRVAAGDVMIRLDATVARAAYAALTRDLCELQAQRSRLEAERDGLATVVFPADLAEAARDPEVARILGGESNLFALRLASRAGQKQQLEQRIAELGQQVAGLIEQRHAKDSELAIAGKELVGVRDLFQRNLVQLTRIDTLERDVARVTGERGALTADIAQTNGKIAETRLQILQVDADLRSEVGRQLAEIRAKLSDIAARRVAAADQLQHLDIRAPQAGLVHELAVHASGAVITPGETILVVVPDQDKLVAEVRVAAQDIDKVSPEQPVILRFPSFNQRTTPEVEAKVARIAANTIDDMRGGVPFYTVQIGLPSMKEIKGEVLRPGMPVDAYMKTRDRSMLSYLIKPIVDQMGRAFHEE